MKTVAKWREDKLVVLHWRMEKSHATKTGWQEAVFGETHWTDQTVILSQPSPDHSHWNQLSCWDLKSRMQAWTNFLQHWCSPQFPERYFQGLKKKKTVCWDLCVYNFVPQKYTNLLHLYNRNSIKADNHWNIWVGKRVKIPPAFWHFLWKAIISLLSTQPVRNLSPHPHFLLMLLPIKNIHPKEFQGLQ